MLCTMLSGKMLVSMLPRHKGDAFVALTKKAGARGGTVTPGRTIAGNPILQALLLADSQQDIVFTLMREEASQVLDAVRALSASHPKKIGGAALVLDVSGILVRTERCACPTTAARSERMESGYVLLTVIVNNGYADDVMAKARKSGAEGGTILTGRGTGTEDDVKFFGITLVPEKEVLMIIVRSEHVTPIIESIRTIPHLSEPGAGIVFLMNVEEFIPLGK